MLGQFYLTLVTSNLLSYSLVLGNSFMDQGLFHDPKDYNSRILASLIQGRALWFRDQPGTLRNAATLQVIQVRDWFINELSRAYGPPWAKKMYDSWPSGDHRALSQAAKDSDVTNHFYNHFLAQTCYSKDPCANICC